MADLATLQTQLAQLQEIRAGGAEKMRTGDKEVTYRREE
jgi:hypothetical protein